MFELIGNLDKQKLGKYKYKIITTEVILTDERKNHIYQNHIMDYNLIMKNLVRIVNNPKEIIEDSKNKNTIFLIGDIINQNLNVVIRLNTENDIKHTKNSIMTAWIVRDSNLKKIRKRNKIIYKGE